MALRSPSRSRCFAASSCGGQPPPVAHAPCPHATHNNHSKLHSNHLARTSISRLKDVGTQPRSPLMWPIDPLGTTSANFAFRFAAPPPARPQHLPAGASRPADHLTRTPNCFSPPVQSRRRGSRTPLSCSPVASYLPPGSDTIARCDLVDIQPPVD